jgi:hypothetical protein
MFLLVAEGLSCLVRNAMRMGSLEGIKIAEMAPKINHLLFASGRS